MHTIYNFLIIKYIFRRFSKICTQIILINENKFLLNFLIKIKLNQFELKIYLKYMNFGNSNGEKMFF